MFIDDFPGPPDRNILIRTTFGPPLRRKTAKNYTIFLLINF